MSTPWWKRRTPSPLLSPLPYRPTNGLYGVLCLIHPKSSVNIALVIIQSGSYCQSFPRSLTIHGRGCQEATLPIASVSPSFHAVTRTSRQSPGSSHNPSELPENQQDQLISKCVPSKSVLHLYQKKKTSSDMPLENRDLTMTRVKPPPP